MDASFSPSIALINLGANPAVISGNKTIEVNPNPLPVIGEPFALSADNNLYISNGDNNPLNDTVATGLLVSPGASLTLELNMVSHAEFLFANDVHILGTVETDDVDPLGRGGVMLTMKNYYAEENTLIDTRGRLPGQSGGLIQLSTPPAFNFLFNHGDLITSGADNGGGNAGNGGAITIISWGPFENTGNIIAIGGIGSLSGGEGGAVDITTRDAYLYNSGAIATHGGTGGDHGGPGGDVVIGAGIASDLPSELRNSGNINTSGGLGLSSYGDFAGIILLAASSAELKNNADLIATGGDTRGLVANAGGGGQVRLITFASSTIAGGGHLRTAGSILTYGGSVPAASSRRGGNGGRIILEVDASGFISGVPGVPPPTDQRLEIFGLNAILGSGGDGNVGGNAAMQAIANYGSSWLVNTYVDDNGGDVINEAHIIAQGGNVTTTAVTSPASGGLGGAVIIKTDDDPTVTNAAAEHLTNSGNINTSGGNNWGLTAPNGNNAATINLYAANDLHNSGKLSANGGNDRVNDDSLTTGFGNDAAFVISLKSEPGDLINTGNIEANGGDGEALGGNGIVTAITIEGVTVNNAGDLSATGGNADAALAGSIGGNGGNLEFLVNNPLTDFTNTGVFNMSGGSGDTVGTDGNCQINLLPC